MTSNFLDRAALRQAIVLAGGQSVLARHVGLTPPSVSHWLCGRRPLPAKHAAAIEALLKGRVRARQLLPQFPWPSA
jgi:DNA-binding transcriptional regulator YdaS (Cro superfamily)